MLGVGLTCLYVMRYLADSAAAINEVNVQNIFKFRDINFLGYYILWFIIEFYL